MSWEIPQYIPPNFNYICFQEVNLSFEFELKLINFVEAVG